MSTTVKDSYFILIPKKILEHRLYSTALHTNREFRYWWKRNKHNQSIIKHWIVTFVRSVCTCKSTFEATPQSLKFAHLLTFIQYQRFKAKKWASPRDDFIYEQENHWKISSSVANASEIIFHWSYPKMMKMPNKPRTFVVIAMKNDRPDPSQSDEPLQSKRNKSIQISMINVNQMDPRSTKRLTIWIQVIWFRYTQSNWSNHRLPLQLLLMVQ